MQSDREARIRERAYQIWLSEGERHGRHEEHWQQAEREIAEEDAAAGGPRAAGTRVPRSRPRPPVTTDASPAAVSDARAEDEAASEKSTATAGRSRQASPIGSGD